MVDLRWKWKTTRGTERLYLWSIWKPQDLLPDPTRSYPQSRIQPLEALCCAHNNKFTSILQSFRWGSGWREGNIFNHESYHLEIMLLFLDDLSIISESYVIIIVRCLWPVWKCVCRYLLVLVETHQVFKLRLRYSDAFHIAQTRADTFEFILSFCHHVWQW